MSVLGSIARNVGDAAFLFSALAGPDPRSPVSIAEPGARFARSLARDFRQVRVAWWSTRVGRLAGHEGIPADPRLTAVPEAPRRLRS